MNNRPSATERRHLARVKEMNCGVCNAEGPSEAHHVRQHYQYLCIPLCINCHKGPRNGWHGERFIWNAKKLDELMVLNETLRALL